MSPKLSNPIRMSLANQVLVSLALGIVCGLVFGEMLSPLQVVGNLFIKLLQITVIPYITLSLITAIGRLHFHEIKSLAIKGGCVLLFSWGIVLSVVVLIPLAYPSWPAASFFSASLVEDPQQIDFFELFIPFNPFYSFANAKIPAIVVFSILVGTALTNLPHKARLLEPLTILNDAMMEITKIIANFSPFGVFALIASAFGTVAIEDLARLQVYLILYALIAIFLGLIVLPLFITTFTPFRYLELIQALRTPLITAFATGSSLIILPMLIEIVKRMIDSKMRSLAEDESEAAVQALIPTFYPFPSPANLLSLSFILFSGWYMGSDMPVSSYLPLIVAGLPSLFGGTTITIPFLLDFMKLPSDMFQLFLSVDVIASRFGTLLAGMHYATIGLIGTAAMLGNIRFRWRNLLKVLLFCMVAIAPILIGIKAFYNNLVVAPYTKDNILMGLRLQNRPQPHTIRLELPDSLYSRGGNPATPAQIEERGVLNVCYQPNEYPSAYLNNQNPPELVGFDIEMTHLLARRIQLPLEFLPAETENKAAALLNNGSCDIYMRSLPISWINSKIFELTTTVYNSSIGLIVKDHRRHEFQSWEDIIVRGDTVRLGVENRPESIQGIRNEIPEATIVPINTVQQQRKILESGMENVDAILDQAEEAAAYTILYPEYALVVPHPVTFSPVSYAVAKDNKQLLRVVNTWLLAEQANDRITKLYRYWMLGEASKMREKPRWSVVHDVLGWGRH